MVQQTDQTPPWWFYLAVVFLWPVTPAYVAALWKLYADRQEKLRKAGLADARLEDFRWQIEELRVSLFAQELKTPMPVSVKRLSPFGSAEVTAKTKVEVSTLDLPDWQFLEAKTVIQANE